MRILHFAPDKIFLDFVQKTFEEVYPGQNKYRVRGHRGAPLQFLNAGNNVRIVGPRYWRSRAVFEDMKDCDCLLIHYMTPEVARAVASVPDNVVLGWIGWGGDYYPLIEPYFGGLQLPETKKIVSQLHKGIDTRISNAFLKISRSIHNPTLLKSKIRDLLVGPQNQHRDIKNIAPRLDFVWINPEEVPYFEKALPAFKGQYHRICYYSAKEIFGVGCCRMDGPDILIGNSATPTNNHVDLFKKLEAIDLSGRQLIVPLGSGDHRYAEKIERIGRSIFGSRFIALRRFMPLDEYYELIGRCGTVIMNHVRQQAGTTVATALYKGAKVYLRNENIIAPFYRKMGIRIRSVQDDFMPDLNLFGPLFEREVKKNQRILQDYWGYNSALNDIRDLYGFFSEKTSLSC